MFDGASGVLPCGAFRLDVDRGRLLDRLGRPVALRPKSLGLLQALLRREGRVVPAGTLLDEVWGHAAVTPDSVTQCVIEIRRALGPDAGLVLRTVRGRGYLLEAAPVHPHAARPSLAVRPFAGHDGRAARRIGAALAEELAVELLRHGGIDLRSGRRHGAAPDASHLLEGGVRAAGGRLRVTARLVETAGLALIWAERYELAGGDSARAQDQVARQVADAVGRRLAPAVADQPAPACSSSARR